MSLSTPVLFLIFNRPDLTRRVFEQIREAQPAQLFIAADGPRADRPNEEEICRETRSIVNEVDWDCELYTLYRETNLGCGLGPATAINWFFENVEQGVILEDDCLPTQSFFSFCEELLEFYKDNTDIIAISGTNILEEFPDPYSFIFSYYGGIWGWATWKRAWNLYDYEMTKWSDVQIQWSIANLLSDNRQFREIKNLFDNKHMVTTWDIQWFFTRLAFGGLSVVPTKNLVSNIGFRHDATHTLNVDSQFSHLQAFDLEFPLRINPNIKVNRMYDRLNAEKYGYYKKNYSLAWLKNYFKISR